MCTQSKPQTQETQYTCSIKPNNGLCKFQSFLFSNISLSFKCSGYTIKTLTSEHFWSVLMIQSNLCEAAALHQPSRSHIQPHQSHKVKRLLPIYINKHPYHKPYSCQPQHSSALIVVLHYPPTPNQPPKKKKKKKKNPSPSLSLSTTTTRTAPPEQHKLVWRNPKIIT